MAHPDEEPTVLPDDPDVLDAEGGGADPDACPCAEPEGEPS